MICIFLQHSMQFSLGFFWSIEASQGLSSKEVSVDLLP